MSVPQENSSSTSESPALEIDRISTRLLTVPRASSSGRDTKFSTSSGAASGYSVRTVRVG